MTMPVRWSLVVLILLFLISLLTYARIARSSSSSSQRTRSSRSSSSSSPSNNSPFKKSSLTLHHLQEERTLRDRNARLQQDLEEDILQLELDCSSLIPSSSDASSDSSPSSLSKDELALQQADFEQELALETQRLIQKHRFDGTLLNESPSAFQRYLKRQLRRQRRLQSAYKETLQQQTSLSYNSQECIAWRAKKKLLSRLNNSTDNRNSNDNKKYINKHNASSNRDTALSRFQQFHPDRQGLEADSVLVRTLDALNQKRYMDNNGFVVELDPVKIVAGSRRASSYQNDDIHVLVLDMQWDPEVEVVVGNVLDETVKLRQEGYRPVMLNVGHDEVPGGDYHLDSAKDNEADLFRRTTLHQCLDQEPRRSRFYPLPEFGGIYCPNQAVFRHGLERDNEFMDRFEWISVVSVAPIPKLETREKDGGLGGVQFLDGEDDVLRRKILAAMKVGVSQGHDALVLPPHGTDAGQNPSEAIAAIYRSIIGRDFMGGRKRFQTYKKIVMVLDPEQAYKVVNETSNYRPARPPVTATPLPDFDEEEGAEEEEEEVDDNDQDDEDKDTTEPEAEGESVDDDVLAKRSTDEDVADSDADEEEEYENENDGLNDQSVEEESEFGEENTTTVTDKDSVEYNANRIVPGLYDDEDEETIDEDVTAEEDDEENELVPDDEVSESDALVEEQNVEEDEDSMNEVDALDEDVNDPLLSPNNRHTADDNADQDDQDEGYDGSEGDMSDQAQDHGDENEYENDDEDALQEEDEEEEEFVQIVETVRDVFERMLEPRSLLIIKNRARGLLDTDEADSKNRTLADVASPNPAVTAGVVPTATSA
ncbi:hypothetical protein BG005_002121 [Podila minutissima]|nr:hypothetical protein BG005_002121 [Podila minutissima]